MALNVLLSQWNANYFVILERIAFCYYEKSAKKTMKF